MSKSQDPVIVEQAFSSSKEELWKAITEMEQMKKWFFENIPAFKAEVGFQTSFNVLAGERNFPHRWTILEVIPQEKIVYDWKYDGYEGEGLVTFELEETEGKTLLKLTAEGMETFPQEIPEFSRESCQGGWNYFIKEQLKEYLI
ncbi:SRPBCC domain-containing protein [Flammeovirgaceae bacterium SG7u.111]|nr:SRPBCC domain-containing protein [Flammeovirgaceae bacterium SG7u.132]WPO38595.1 SRPBCC domain-containing protein [Flammeovirgaceae bacterium SG7u.111]